jgi:hypothetical protein
MSMLLNSVEHLIRIGFLKNTVEPLCEVSLFHNLFCYLHVPWTMTE